MATIDPVYIINFILFLTKIVAIIFIIFLLFIQTETGEKKTSFCGGYEIHVAWISRTMLYPVSNAGSIASTLAIMSFFCSPILPTYRKGKQPKMLKVYCFWTFLEIRDNSEEPRCRWCYSVRVSRFVENCPSRPIKLDAILTIACSFYFSFSKLSLHIQSEIGKYEIDNKDLCNVIKFKLQYKICFIARLFKITSYYHRALSKATYNVSLIQSFSK